MWTALHVAEHILAAIGAVAIVVVGIALWIIRYPKDKDG